LKLNSQITQFKDKIKKNQSKKGWKKGISYPGKPTKLAIWFMRIRQYFRNQIKMNYETQLKKDKKIILGQPRLVYETGIT